MKFLFCPNCAGISTMIKQPNGTKQCSRCKFVGDPKEGTAEEANALMKRIKSGYGTANPGATAGTPQKSDASSMNAIKDSALKENSDKKKIDIVVDEKLKALKGKRDGNSEFL